MWTAPAWSPQLLKVEGRGRAAESSVCFLTAAVRPAAAPTARIAAGGIVYRASYEKTSGGITNNTAAEAARRQRSGRDVPLGRIRAYKVSTTRPKSSLPSRLTILL